MACTCDENDSCTCKVVSGLNMIVFGYGTEIEPITMTTVDLVLTVVDTATIDANLIGDGDIPSPYVLSMKVKPAVLADYARRWVGTEEEYAGIYHEVGTIHVVTTPTPHMVGPVNLYAGDAPAQKVYAGDVLIAERVGGVLVPPV